MRTALLSLVLATIAATTPACVGKNGAGPVWGPVINCAGNEAGDHAQDVLDVLRAGGDGMDAALEQLGLQYGQDVVACIIRAFTDRVRSSAQPADQDVEAAARGRAFLARKGVTFSGGAQ